MAGEPMAYTYSTPETRARTRDSIRGVSAASIEAVLLVLGALAVVVGVGFAYAARTAAIEESTARHPNRRVVNLNAVESADTLAAALDVFPETAERVFVAREIIAALSGTTSGPTSRLALPNVGALTRLTVDTSRIRSARGLTTLRQRLAGATGRGTPPPARPRRSAARCCSTWRSS
jgi:hypothetical protein